MTRTTNARIAGVTFLVYIAAGITKELGAAGVLSFCHANLDGYFIPKSLIPLMQRGGVKAATIPYLHPTP